MTLKEIAIELFNNDKIQDIHIIDEVVVFYNQDIEYNIRFVEWQKVFVLNGENGLNFEFITLKETIDFVLM